MTGPSLTPHTQSPYPPSLRPSKFSLLNSTLSDSYSPATSTAFTVPNNTPAATQRFRGANPFQKLGEEEFDGFVDGLRSRIKDALLGPPKPLPREATPPLEREAQEEDVFGTVVAVGNGDNGDVVMHEQTEEDTQDR
jgi:hypothetical protein